MLRPLAWAICIYKIVNKVAEEVLLPELHEGDFVVMHDAGANTLSTFSRCSSLNTHLLRLPCCSRECGCPRRRCDALVHRIAMPARLSAADFLLVGVCGSLVLVVLHCLGIARRFAGGVARSVHGRRVLPAWWLLVGGWVGRRRRWLARQAPPE